MKRRFQASLPADLSAELATVTPHQLEALHYLRHLQASQGVRGATMNELARAQRCALSSATALADRLIGHGLAERVSDPADRRVVQIVPTKRGEELTQRFGAARRQMALQALAPLSDEEVELLVDLVRKIATPSGADDARVAAYG